MILKKITCHRLRITLWLYDYSILIIYGHLSNLSNFKDELEKIEKSFSPQIKSGKYKIVISIEIILLND